MVSKKKKAVIGAAVAMASVGLGGVTASAMSVQQMATAAVSVANEYGLYPSVMIAQAILESGGGNSALATQYNNYFGVKYTSGQGVDLPTTEYINGQSQEVVQKFQVYGSPEESFQAHARLLRSAFYSGAWRENAASYQEATAALQGRYATDPNYANLLNNIIATYDLTAYDGSGASTSPAVVASATGGTAAGTYTVQSGDTLSGIAAANGTTVTQIASANGLGINSTLQIGQVLQLSAATAPTASPAVSAASTGTYVVKEGDTLWKIAQENGTTTASLASYNGISADSILSVGQTLTLTGESTEGVTGSGTYTVRSGDTLSGIAQAHGLTVGQLAALNGLSDLNKLGLGQVLKV